jgi:hypothetical protein
LEVTPFSGRKPFMGGFRDARTALEYHDACSQTPPPPPAWTLLPPKFERDAQTAGFVESRSAQSARESCAQTAVRGLHQGTSGDRELAPRRPYVTSEMVHARRVRAAVELQRHWRAAMARAEAKARRRAAEVAAAGAAAAAEAAAGAAAARAAADQARRLHPRTRADFALLYDEVEAWRVATTARIHAEVPKEDLTAAFSAMLQKETALLATIDKLRAEAARARAEEATEKRLAQMAGSERWALSHVPKAARAAAVDVETPLTNRAAELKRLYDALGIAALAVEDRTEVLLHVKYTVGEVDCALTRELRGLVDRELDQLARGRPAAALEGLRARIRTLFLSFCDTPEFNPRAAKVGAAAPGRDQRTLAHSLRTAPLPPGGGPATKAKSFMVNQGGSLTSRR